jgi:hypothetical protein
MSGCGDLVTAEAATLGFGGTSIVARATGVSRRAIRIGGRELKQKPRVLGLTGLSRRELADGTRLSTGCFPLSVRIGEGNGRFEVRWRIDGVLRNVRPHRIGPGDHRIFKVRCALCGRARAHTILILSKVHLHQMISTCSRSKIHGHRGADLGEGSPVRREIYLSSAGNHDIRTAFSGSTAPRSRPVNDH